VCKDKIVTDIAAWEERLHANFGQDGVIGHGLEPYREASARYGYWFVDHFRGFMALSEAFLDFHFGLPELVNDYVTAPLNRTGGQASVAYSMGVVRHMIDFRLMYSARELAFMGSVLEGAALMRLVFDAAIVRSAIVQRLSTIEAAEGVTALAPGEPLDYEAVRKARIKEEKRIDGMMVGNASGLTEETIAELRKWESLLHGEIHGGRLSQATALAWLKGQEPLAMVPRPREFEVAMFMNRWVEVAWMVHRLMPTLQLPAHCFSAQWNDKWRVLDESFVPAVQALSSQLKKKIGGAMVEFVTKKFPFDASSTCEV